VLLPDILMMMMIVTSLEARRGLIGQYRAGQKAEGTNNCLSAGKGTDGVAQS
jgi:hypothetical protein